MPVNIHGRSYNTVAERIASAKDDLISVQTEVLYVEPVVIRATITTKKGTFTGISAANPSKTLEKESPWEVAETSAVGRALAFAGYETSNGIASAEEMKKLEPKVDENFDGVSVPCKQCGADTIYKTGTTAEGKSWKGYFCSKDRSHKPYFVK